VPRGVFVDSLSMELPMTRVDTQLDPSLGCGRAFPAFCCCCCWSQRGV